MKVRNNQNKNQNQENTKAQGSGNSGALHLYRTLIPRPLRGEVFRAIILFKMRYYPAYISERRTMLDSLSLWLHETPLGETLLTMLISMLPVVELRGGLPAGVAMGLPIPVAFIASLVGNMIPVPFIILFVRPLFQWVRIHIPKLEGFISHLEARAEAKSADVLRYQTWGLLIFVAIPLPGTGAWTGALIAAVLNMRLKRAVPVIFLGVVIAGCIITLLTHGVTLLF